MIDQIPATKREYTRSLVCVWQSLHRGNLPTRLQEHRAHGRRGDFEKSSIVKHSHIKVPPNRMAGSQTHQTYQLMAYQTHQGGHRNLQARHCSTGHRFLHQLYLATPTTDRRIFYIQSPQPNPGISYILSQPPSLPVNGGSRGGPTGAMAPQKNRSCTPPPPPPPKKKKKKKKKKGKKRDKTKPHNFTPPPCAAKSCLYVQLLLKYANYNTLIGYMNVFIILLTIQHCHKICNGSLCS